MVSLFRKPPAEPDLDNRIAGLARRRGLVSSEPAEPRPDDSAPPSRRFADLSGAPQPTPSDPQTEPSPRLEALTAEAPHAEALPEPAFRQAPTPTFTPKLLPHDEPASESEPAVFFPQPESAIEAAAPFAAGPGGAPQQRPAPTVVPHPAMAPPRAPASAESGSLDDKLAAAKIALSTRLSSEIRPERRSLLSRGELAKLVDAAVQAHFVRNAINADPLARRDLVTSILQELLNPGGPDPEALGHRRTPHRALVEAAKAQIQPLVLEHMDIAAAAEMPRPAFEAQLTGWVKELLAETKIQLNFAEQRELVESLIADMLGLGPLEPLMADETITDIMVNGPRQVYVERRGKLELADVQFRDDQHVMNVATKIVSRIGRRIDESKPLVDARLEDGSRVNIIIPPLALDGPSISIRKFAKKTITLDIMAQGGSISVPMATVLKIAARCRLNILISGGTGSGKTTLLNAMSRMIDPAERTVTIEDAAELQLQQPHVVRLETRPANLEGSGEITMRDLLKNTLRMRPDRIIIGECRGEEALDMLQAMNTGHDGSMSTIHANNPREALTRLENMISMGAVNLPSKAMRTQIASAIHLICQVSRMRDGARRVTHIVEVVGMEGDIITTQELFTYQFQGETGEGRLRGAFQPTGIRPAFLPRAEYFGLDRALLEAI
ncbi:MAG TPA: ATPase, T2SS/T4P/T4SS family [Stellaceae bacterium]|nr:ATPase, T2SS/T4P/T4SS family [Stellaceae bacterium]